MLIQTFLSRSFSYNKYSQVAARAIRSGLKESERIKADKRALVTLKKQIWDHGVPSESVSPPVLCCGRVRGGRRKERLKMGSRRRTRKEIRWKGSPSQGEVVERSSSLV